MNKIIIAIDGFSACGKSTTAIGVAEKLNYKYIDSGAMYRAVTLYCIENNIDVNNNNAVSSILGNLNIEFQTNNSGNSEIYLNGEKIENKIREMSVSKLVSEVARIPEVREKMVAMQQEYGKNKGIVMDGRDIGTNVFINAELKFFLTANFDVRVERRLKELMEKNLDSNREEVIENLKKRDEIDQNRKDNPLVKAKDAILMDTSAMSIEGQINEVVQKAKKIIEAI